MIGITDIAYHIPNTVINNYEKKYPNVNEEFINDKIGIQQVSVKDNDEETSDLCVKAYHQLITRNPGFLIGNVDCIVVCTQNGDFPIPHTSAIVHNKLGAKPECAVFDISLGCSGYVHSLHIMKNFMQAQNFSTGLLFTCDPYSKIIDPDDYHINLLLGDAAAVTILSNKPVFTIQKPVFNTNSKDYSSLIKRNKYFQMNGRNVLDYAVTAVPKLINDCLNINEMTHDQIDHFLFHQASKAVIDRLREKLKLDEQQAPFVIANYGNTASSSIPILLQNYLNKTESQHLLLCGFGVGLSSTVSILKKG